MRVYLGADHAGYELKEHLIVLLKQAGHDPHDCGPYHYDPDDDYPPFCIATAQQVLADPGSLGIVIGGSGNGEQIAANKVPGIRCALAWSPQTAQLAREHNNAQIISLGARMHTPDQAWNIVEAFLGAHWSAEPRHLRRITLLDHYELTHIAPPLPD